ncbi:hypothetical protein [Magnetospirillum sp. UT-4]|uniref:hypothetical protein n=1 Tax=Magnetospirillum sp. UT-4 TaxID=2681467 RepID=UPI00157359C1|nr:hypothetical protein [Magnetospirillum sp. UT-4]
MDEGAYLYRRTGAKKGRWQLYAYVDGDEVKQSTGTADLEAAKVIARKALTAARERRARGQSARRHLFADVAEQFLKERVGGEADWRRLSEDEVRKRKFVRQRMVDYLLPYFGERIGRKPLEEINSAQIRAYAGWRQERRGEMVEARRKHNAERIAQARERWTKSARLQKAFPNVEDYLPSDSLGSIQAKVSAAAINKELSILRAIFAFAQEKGWARKNDLPDVENVKIGNSILRNGFTEEEFKKLRDTARQRFNDARDEAMRIYRQRFPQSLAEELLGDQWKQDATAWSRFVLWCAIDILAGTGMRPSTLVRLTRGMVQSRPVPEWDEVPPEWLATAETPYILTGLTHKGSQRLREMKRKWAIVPEAKCWPAITRLLNARPQAPDTPLIDIQPLSLNKAFKKVLRQCGLEHTGDGLPRSLYDLRHYYITKALLAGQPTAKVAVNTMTSLQMIERHYNHVPDQQNFEDFAILKLPTTRRRSSG